MATLPFTYLPQQIIINLVQFVVMWLNALPKQSRISRRWSPQGLVCCHQLDVNKHRKTPFGSYCEVHEELQPTNSMIP